MPLPFRLYLISDRARMGADPAGMVASLAQAGLRAFQWREKDQTPAASYEALRSCSDRLGVLGLPPGRFRLFANDRADLALSLGLSLQLTENSIPTRVARSLLPPGSILGRSTHSLERARQAQVEGADFVTFGPVYETPSKRAYGPPLGIERAREACRALSIPVIVIGGITPERIPECLAAGASGVALIGAVWGAPDPIQALTELMRAVKEE